MQSTTTVACRALVMVVCLITIPLAALFGTSLPDLIKTLGWGTPAVSAREQGGMAPIYAPNIPDAAGLPDAATPRLSVSGAEQVEHLPQPPPAPRLPDDMRTVQASFNEPATPQPAAEAPFFGNGTVPTNPGQRATVPVARQGADSRFEQIQQRLRDLGATEFLLGWFGSSRQFYRFQCEMPLSGQTAGERAAAGGPTAVRHFESTSENSLQAMENVLAEVEAWLRQR